MPIYKQPKGKYRVNVNFKDPITGKYKQATKRGIKTKAEAMRIEAQMIIDVKRTPMEKQFEIDSSIINRLRICDLIDDYLDTQSKILKKTTIRGTRQVLQTHINPYLGDRYLLTLGLNDFKSWKLKIDDYVSPKTHVNLQIKSKKNIYKKFNALLNYAYKYYGYSNNVLPRVGDFMSIEQVGSKDLQYWTLRQFKEFSFAIREDAEQSNKYIRWGLYVMFNLLYFCGLRKGEAHALRWSDITKNGNYWVLHINKSLSQKVRNDDGSYYISTPKNKSSIRVIPISNYLATIIGEHYNRSRLIIPSFENNLYIVGGPAPISDTLIDKVKDYYADKCRLPRIKIHGFRHSFVSLLINQDINIKTISALVGHSTVDQTWNTYGHLYPEKQNEAIKAIDSLMGTNSTNTEKISKK